VVLRRNWNHYRCRGNRGGFEVRASTAASRFTWDTCIGFAYDAAYNPIYVWRRNTVVPVVYHTGDTYFRARKGEIMADPLTIDEVAVDHPRVKFVIAPLRQSLGSSRRRKSHTRMPTSTWSARQC
jgi:hypothetical protein